MKKAKYDISEILMANESKRESMVMENIIALKLGPIQKRRYWESYYGIKLNFERALHYSKDFEKYHSSKKSNDEKRVLNFIEAIKKC